MIMKQKWTQALFFSLLGIIAFCFVAIFFRVFSLNDLPISFMGACLGAIISAIITQVLLAAQTETEEVKQRNVKIFEKKSEIFQEYISELRGIWEKQKINPEDFVKLSTDFRINLMIYLQQKPINQIAEHLDKLGDCSVEKVPDFDKLNDNIFGIINILSHDLGFTGRINPVLNKRFDDKINRFSKSFREAILKELNMALLGMENNILKEGSYERLDDGGEYACFYFTNQKYNGCKIIIGSLSQYCAHGGVYLGLYAEKNIHAVDDFRWDDDEESNCPEFSKYWVGIFDLKGRNEWVELTTNLPDDEMNKKIGEFQHVDNHSNGDRWLFLDRPSAIEDYRENYHKIARIIGQRAAWWFEHGEMYIDDESTDSIINFLEKYLGKQEA
jgi:hypothetical protein